MEIVDRAGQQVERIQVKMKADAYVCSLRSMDRHETRLALGPDLISPLMSTDLERCRAHGMRSAARL
jgi:hypothetical protein